MLSRHIRPFSFPVRQKNRSRQAYAYSRAGDGSSTESDAEKRLSIEDEDWESDSSSQSSPSTPLRKHKSKSAIYKEPGELVNVRAIRRDSQGRPLRLRRRYGRYFSVCLGLALVVLGVTLWQLSASSARAVSQGFKHLSPEKNAEIWENFEPLERYFGGVRKMVPKKKNNPEWPDAVAEAEQLRNLTSSKDDSTEESEAGDKTVADKKRRKLASMTPYDPYTKDSSRIQCFLDTEDTIRPPQLSVYNGVVEGMPDPGFGSYDIFGMQNDVCFERFGRFGPYGLGYSQKKGGSGAGMEGDREGIEDVWAGIDGAKVDWRKVKWNKAQKACWSKNKNRFLKTLAEAPRSGGKATNSRDELKEKVSLTERSTRADHAKLPRTVVLLRTWHNYEYSTEDILHLRALISELSLHSGSEYEVHFLIHVKDDDSPIWGDDATYKSVLNSSLPAEFAGMGSLWSERQMSFIYGGLADSNFRDMSVHGVYRSNFMALQWFSHEHPEFDYIWQWEMDVRYIGHYYELLDRVSKWSAKQPRKGLWERNARFYVPSEHGSWDDFKQMVRVQTEHGTSSSWRENAEVAASEDESGSWEKEIKAHAALQQAQQGPEQPVWGPIDNMLNPSDHFELKKNLKPPHPAADDKYEWGVGEEADLITFSPLFDPSSTTWLYHDDVSGYNRSTGPGGAPRLPPRRVAIGTTGLYYDYILKHHHGTAM